MLTGKLAEHGTFSKLQKGTSLKTYVHQRQYTSIPSGSKALPSSVSFRQTSALFCPSVRSLRTGVQRSEAINVPEALKQCKAAFSFHGAKYYSSATGDQKGYVQGMLRKTLNTEQENFVAEEVRILKHLKTTLKSMNANKDDLDLLSQSLAQIEDLFLLVIVGEFNSGKSSFLNALIGKRYLKEGVTPTTSKIGILKWGEQSKIESDGVDTENITVPVDWLKEIHLVDTPGTNAVVKGHQQITEHFVPRSDLVLFITSADRAFSESERKFLENIRQWKKKIVVVISKVDTIETDDDLAAVKNFVASNFRDLLGIEPLIYPVSSKLALNAKVASPDQDALQANPNWVKSRFGELESYIAKTLTKEERTKLKLENPIGVGEHLISKYSDALEARAKVLESDVKAMENIRAQIEEYKKSMQREFRFQQSEIDNALLQMNNRAQDYLEETLKFTNLWDLIRSEKIKANFEKNVVADTSVKIERQVNDIIDIILQKNAKMWADTMDYLQRRVTINPADLVGQVNTTFEYDRAGLIKTIGNSATGIVASYDKVREAEKLSQEMKSALVGTAAVEVGALGLGTIFAASLLDITGVVGAGALAATGLAIIPYKRATLKKAFTKKVDDLRYQLASSLNSHFEAELQNSIRKLEDNIDPYSRFILAEKEKSDKLTSEFHSLKKNLGSLRINLGKLFVSK